MTSPWLFHRWAVLLCCALWPAGICFGAETTTTLEGIVEDLGCAGAGTRAVEGCTGVGLRDVKVTVFARDGSILKWQLTSDDGSGSYSIPGLPAGSIVKVTYHRIGYKYDPTVKDPVTLTPPRTTMPPIPMVKKLGSTGYYLAAAEEVHKRQGTAAGAKALVDLVDSLAAPQKAIFYDHLRTLETGKPGSGAGAAANNFESKATTVSTTKVKDFAKDPAKPAAKNAVKDAATAAAKDAAKAGPPPP